MGFPALYLPLFQPLITLFCEVVQRWYQKGPYLLRTRFVQGPLYFLSIYVNFRVPIYVLKVPKVLTSVSLVMNMSLPILLPPHWFLPNFKCRKGPPRLDFLGPPSGYDLPRYPPVAWWGVRFLILQSVIFETPYAEGVVEALSHGRWHVEWGAAWETPGG